MCWVGAGPGRLGGGAVSDGGYPYRRQASVENPLIGTQPPPLTGNVPAPTPSSHCRTAVTFLSMVTHSTHESLGFANCNPQNTLGDGVFHAHITDGEAEAQGGQRPTYSWSHTCLGTDLSLRPGVLTALLGRAPRSRCRDRGVRGSGSPRGVEAAPDQLGPQRTLGRSWLWRHWTSWTGVWISWRHCRHGTQWGKWPPTR